jgi:hypothetical protein
LLDDAAVVRLRVAHRRQVGRQVKQPELHRRSLPFSGFRSLVATRARTAYAAASRVAP